MPSPTLCVSCALLIMVVAGACQSNRPSTRGDSTALQSKHSANAAVPAPPATALAPQAVSLLGRPLHASVLPADVSAQRERELDEARYEYDRDPHNEQAIIWYGRRLAYLGRYDEAINVFSVGLVIHPDSAELLRHRGHRYITIRKFDLAAADLSRAAVIVADLDDRLEPDGQPNARNQPRSTLKTNILYHLGLAEYLLGNLSEAAKQYHQCLRLSPNDDMRVAAAYWLYLSSSRTPSGERQAAEALQAVQSTEDVFENLSYYRLVQLFRNEITPEQVTVSSEGDASIDAATVGYGLGMWNQLNRRSAEAGTQFRAVIDTTNWAAFGHIAAEAELARQRK